MWNEMVLDSQNFSCVLVIAGIRVYILALRQKQWLQSSREKRSKDKTRPTEFIMA